MAAKAAVVSMWSGYLATRPGVNLLRPWSQAEFETARLCGATPIAFCSGIDDPSACKAFAQQWNVRLCLDVESGIRGDGAWVQPWLNASGAGLYGNAPVFPGRTAPFYVLAQYPGYNPNATWGLHTKPNAPVGWQWQGTHDEFGVEVDRGWYDDWFLGGVEVLSYGFKVGLSHIMLKAIYQREPTQQELFDQANAINDDGSNLANLVQDLSTNIANDPSGRRWENPELLKAIDQISAKGSLPTHSHGLTGKTGPPV